ncbi:MAG: hypothetical protein ACERJ2_04985 [Filomicrobium sp.]
MTTSQFIAGLIGPLFMAIAAFMVVRRDTFLEFAKAAARDRPLIFFAGAILLVSGLAIVQVHNLWVADWRVIITLIGWLGVLGGIVRIFLPEFAQSIVDEIKPDHPAVIITAAAYFALGAFLTAKAHSIL